MDRISKPQLREYNEAQSITAARIVRHLDSYVLVVRLQLAQQAPPLEELGPADRSSDRRAPTVRKLEMVL